MMRPVTLALPPNKPDGLSFDGHSGRSRGTTTRSTRRRSWCSGPTTAATWIDARDGSRRRWTSRTSTGSRTFIDTTFDPERAATSTGSSPRTPSATWTARTRQSPVPGNDGPVGVGSADRRHGNVRPGGADRPDGHAAARPAGQARLHRRHDLRDRLHDRACRQRRALHNAHHAAGQHRRRPDRDGPVTYTDATVVADPRRTPPTPTRSGRTTERSSRPGRTRPP